SLSSSIHITSLLVSLPIFYIILPPSYKFPTLYLHDALPILNLADQRRELLASEFALPAEAWREALLGMKERFFGNNCDPEESYKDRKSTRLNSSHVSISYAVFCLKKKKSTSLNFIHVSISYA